MDEFEVENYFYPKSNVRVKSTKNQDLRLLFEVFFPQTFLLISIIYGSGLLIIAKFDFSTEFYGQTLNSIEIYLAITLPAIVILLYQKFGFITLPSIANAIYLLLYQDYNFPPKIDFVLVSINTRILLIGLYVFIGLYMALSRLNNLAEDGLIVYYLSYFSIILSVLIEYFGKNGSGFLVILLIIFITIFILFLFQAVSAFLVGFLIGLLIVRKRMSINNSNFLYPSSDGLQDFHEDGPLNF